MSLFSCVVFILCNITFIVCVGLCAVFCLSVVYYFVWYVYFCVLCHIVVPLPPGKTHSQFQLNYNNNNDNNNNNNKVSSGVASVIWWSEFVATNKEVWIRFPALQHFLRRSGSGKGSTHPREYNWGAIWRNSSGYGLGTREYSFRDLSRWSRGTLFTLTSPTSGGRSIGIVRSRCGVQFFQFKLSSEDTIPEFTLKERENQESPQPR
jgi:hypothetical protein